MVELSSVGRVRSDSQGTFEEVTLPEEDAFHIFVVDDEKAIAETLAIILGKSGFVATSFTNPLEALEKAPMKSPSLLLSDVCHAGSYLASILPFRSRKSAPIARFCYFPGRPKPLIC